MLANKYTYNTVSYVGHDKTKFECRVSCRSCTLIIHNEYRLQI